MKRLKKLLLLFVCAAVLATAIMLFSYVSNRVNYNELTEIKLGYYSWMGSSEYTLTQSDGVWVASLEKNVTPGLTGENSYRQTIVTEDFVQTIRNILSASWAHKWDGFDKRENYYDGGGFMFYAGFSDGKQINARGYMTEPYTFYLASRALSEQFSSLFQ